MSLNATPSSERIHIGFFGRRNAGKSSLVNAFTGQEIAIVSDVKGTTTDPVTKAMELIGFGAVAITDTAGWGDKTVIGDMRQDKTNKVLLRTDFAIYVADGTAFDKAAYETAKAEFDKLVK